MTRIIELIYTDKFTGLGVEKDPCRNVPQLWTKSGKLVAEQDAHTGHSFFDPNALISPIGMVE